MKAETTTFTGPFSKNIKKYLKEKKMIGIKIENLIYGLKSFDTFSIQYNIKCDFLTKDIIYAWLERRPNEKKSNQSSRANIIRGFSQFMNIMDKKSYILPKGIYTCNYKYNAYIYSKKEIDNIFNTIDYCIERQPNKQRKNYSSQIIFRLLYVCGLRISEALNIRIKHFNKEQKLLTIKHAKNDKDRIIPISNELTSLIDNYINQFHILSNESAYLFENKNHKPYSRYTIYSRFRAILKKCKIEHNENGQNLHAFRHTFAVHCLKKWILEGKNLMVYLPILQTFLGHDSLKETAYYLKLTSDVYPNITKAIEKDFNKLIPKMEVCND